MASGTKISGILELVKKNCKSEVVSVYILRVRRRTQKHFYPLQSSQEEEFTLFKTCWKGQGQPHPEMFTDYLLVGVGVRLDQKWSANTHPTAL